MSYASLIRSWAEHVESTTTGHQRSDSRMDRTLYLKHRREKLKHQEERPTPSTSTSSSKYSSEMQSSTTALSTASATSSSSSTPKGDEPFKTKKPVMEGVRVYINGYLCDTTDIEMKRTVTLAGGQVLFVSPPCKKYSRSSLSQRLPSQTPSNATHILTSQGLNGSKTHKHLTKNARNKVHIVKPEWVVDSINTGKRLPERHYAVVVDNTMNSVAAMFGERPYERPLPPSP